MNDKIQIRSEKDREELKRDRQWDPAKRWKVIQETITWAEQQSTVRRNDPAKRLAEQQRKLALFASFNI